VSRLVEMIAAVVLVSGSARLAVPSPAAADLNGDFRVDARDVSALAGQWLSTSSGPADLTGDQLVNMDDLALMGQVWRTGQPGPVITEFMACNKASLLDAQGDSPDWIEICNPTGEMLDLDGWFLTDDVNDLEKWEFPDVKLAPGGYLVVFASGQDQRDPAGQLHTNFALQAAGESVALVAPTATIRRSSSTSRMA
jgi:hypothetical protein